MIHEEEWSVPSGLETHGFATTSTITVTQAARTSGEAKR